MAKPSPIYRTDHLACPLNRGKLQTVMALIDRVRACAKLEARLQWSLFFKGHYGPFEKTATAGWTRPWTEDGRLSVSHAQMVMAQVASSLQGFIGNVQNTYKDLVAGYHVPWLTPDLRHQLHAINRAQAWFSPTDFWVEQAVPVERGPTADKEAVRSALDVPPTNPAPPVLWSARVNPDLRQLARSLMRHALSMHRRPHFRRLALAVDQRMVTLELARQEQGPFEAWVNLATLEKGKRLALPLVLDPHMKGRQAQVRLAHAWHAERGLTQASLPTEKESASKSGPTGAGEKGDDEKGTTLPRFRTGQASVRRATPVKARKDRDSQSVKATVRRDKKATVRRDKKAAQRAAFEQKLRLAPTIRLLLTDDRQTLRIGVVTDCRALFEQETALYQPRIETLALDWGLCTLFVTDRGDLLGRQWLDRLLRLDKVITSITRHRQRLGLKVTDSVRYREKVSAVWEFIKSEVNRIFNRLVTTHAPAHLILEALDFTKPNLSRRLNRILKNFGQALIRAKLLEMEARYGITHEFREAAYTSQECVACGYVAKANRLTQAQFQCQFCNKKAHADVQAARTTGQRRSRPIPFLSTRQRIERTLVERTRAFNERYPRPRGGPADPRFANPYFESWAKQHRGEVFGEIILQVQEAQSQ